jgi:glyoxylase-like metal-dependent hydrolase (beta-lactamase superfamily II)
VVELRQLGPNTYLLPGSPATLLKLVPETNRVTVVDPGTGSNRASEIAEAVAKLEGKPGPILLTHGHSDHLAAAAQLDWHPVYAPKYCLAFVESFWARRLLAYGGLVAKHYSPHGVVEVKVDYWVTDGNPVPGFRAVALPGHTPGHTGYVSEEEGIIYVGDAVFGEKVLEAYGIPFAYDLKAFAETIENKLMRFVDEGYRIVPSHGPVVEGGRARAMLEQNLRRIYEARDLILNMISEKPMTLDKLVQEISTALARSQQSVRNLFLNRLPVMSLLAWLEEEGKIQPVTSSEGVVWRLKSGGSDR